MNFNKKTYTLSFNKIMPHGRKGVRMNKKLRRSIVCIMLLVSCRSVFASHALTVTGKGLVSGISKASLIPFYVMQFPFAVVAELLFNKKIGSSRTTSQEISKVEEPEEIIPGTPKIHTVIQTASPTVAIPQVIGEVISGLPKDSAQPVFINVNVHSQQTALSSHADTTTPVAHTISDKSKSEPPKKQPKSPLKIHQWLRKHIFSSGISCGALIYAGLHCYLWYSAHILAKPENWSPWKSFCSLQDLYQMKQTELLKSLMSSCEDAYQDLNPMANAKRFIKEATSELQLLKRYAAILKFLEKWYLKRLFFVDSSFLTMIPERVQRLEFLINTFTGWLKDHRETYSYDGLFKQTFRQ